jgi:hypothetical protein
MAIFALLVLHQDFWWWGNGYLVFGFMPIGLFYQACISLAAGLTWWVATKYCWPIDLDADEAGAPS